MRGAEKKYLKWHQKVAYGAGDLASNTSYGLVSSFVLLYLSDTMGLNTGIIGTLMPVSYTHLVAFHSRHLLCQFYRNKTHSRVLAAAYLCCQTLNTANQS